MKKVTSANEAGIIKGFICPPKRSENIINYVVNCKIDNLLPAAVMLLFFTFCYSPAFAVSRILEQGIQKYQSKNYKEAANLFKQASKTEERNPVLHYYYGDALVELNLRQDAIKEYQTALSLQSEGQLADYCRQALVTLTAPPSSQTSQVIIARPSLSNSADKLMDQQQAIAAETTAQITAERAKTDNQIKFTREQGEQDMASVNTVALYPEVINHRVREFYGQDPTAMAYKDSIKQKVNQQIQSLELEFTRRKQEIEADGQKRIDGLH